MMTNALVKSQKELLQRTRSWTDLKDDELRRKAMKAANERDEETLWSLTEAFISLRGSSGSKTSSHTFEAYRRGIGDLLKDWQSENLLRPGRDAGVLYIRGIEAKGLKPATVRVKLAAAQSLYKALRWAEATEASPFSDVKAITDKTKAWDKREAYSARDIKQMEQIAEGSNLVILYLGAHSGLRASEMTQLQWKDIDFANQVLTVREGKGMKDARVIMSKSLIKALEHLPRTTMYVLPCRSRHSIKQRINSLCRRASVKARGVHALRHTAGTQLRAQGVEIVEIADHLRHSSLETARGYAKVTDSVARKVVGEW